MAETEEAVKVAVRVRCFNQREKDASSQRIVRMNREDKGSRTWIKNVDTNEEKEFHFDYSFDSHDKSEAQYATQDIVFNDLGRPVLASALEGKNTCLFAYGQTGAGKSFSMLGNTAVPAEQGIVPRTCREIFRLIDMDKANALISSSVTIQIMEIYCEQVNDLLSPKGQWPQGGHKPKLTKDGYVCETITQPCFSYDDIERAFKFADANRSIRAHALNPVSSRAHTIFQIKYEKRTKVAANATQQETITSRLNLVDLAGSERTESAGTSGEGLKEGNAINLSLTALGNTIKALSEGTRPSFRDSKLTLLLQGSMTNGQVIMIAALSPASICYEESVSTLRFAERIKLVKVKAKRNVTIDPVAEIKKQMETMKKQMQDEIDELRKKSGSGGSAPPNSEEVERLRQLLEEQKAAEKALRDDMEKQMQQLQETQNEREQKQAAIRAQWKTALGPATDEKREDIREPHLLNLNAESRLSETLIYKLTPGVTTVGRSNKENPPKFDFSGMGMLKDHCQLIFDEAGKKVTLKVIAPGARCLVNGASVSDSIELKHNFRIWLGNNYAFRFAFPAFEAAGEQFPDPNVRPDYMFAEQEVAQRSMQAIQDAAGASGGSSATITALGHKLSEALKNVEQANIISGDLSQDCAFQAKIITNRITGEHEVVVYVVTPNGTLTWVWDKFHVRLINMVKMWESWQYAQQKDEAFQLPEGNDNPFIDTDYQLIGEADVWLASLGNMIEVELDPPVLSPAGVREGQLHLKLVPLDEKGNEGPWDDNSVAHLDPFVDKPEDLLGKTIQFKVKTERIVFDIDLARGSRAKYRDTWISYRLQKDDEVINTPHDAASNLEQTYNHSHTFKVTVDKTFLHQIEKGKITLYAWGKLIDNAPNMAASLRGVVLPEGWKKVTAYQDPKGALHLTPPGVVGGPKPAAH